MAVRRRIYQNAQGQTYTRSKFGSAWARQHNADAFFGSKLPSDNPTNVEIMQYMINRLRNATGVSFVRHTGDARVQDGTSACDDRHTPNPWGYMCRKCPRGAKCKEKGITFDTIQADKGYWNVKDYFNWDNDEHEILRTSHRRLTSLRKSTHIATEVSWRLQMYDRTKRDGAL